jgi:hypothetical protein
MLCCKRKGHALEHRAIKVIALVIQRQPDEGAARLAVPHGAALAHQVRQEQQAFGAFGNLARAGFERVETACRPASRQNSSRNQVTAAPAVLAPPNT